MATTYGDIANKLSKKLGEYEKVLETSTEPTEIETAKRSIERIQQAMALLKASQQNHPEAQSPVEQGMEQGMMPQGMPAYQANSGTIENAFVGMGGGEARLPSGERGTVDASGNFTKNKIDMGGTVNAGLYGMGLIGSIKQASDLVNSPAEQEAALNKARGTSPLVDQWALNSQLANQTNTNKFPKFPNYGTAFYQTGGDLPSYQAANNMIPGPTSSLGNSPFINQPLPTSPAIEGVEEASTEDLVTALKDVRKVGDPQREAQLEKELWKRMKERKPPTVEILQPKWGEPEFIRIDPETGEKSPYIPTMAHSKVVDSEDNTVTNKVPSSSTAKRAGRNFKETTPDPSSDREAANIGADMDIDYDAMEEKEVFPEEEWEKLLKKGTEEEVEEEEVEEVVEEGDKYTRRDPLTFQERDKQQNPLYSALGLAPTLGNLYMGMQDRDYYPGFKNPYADQLGRDLGDMRGLLADSETELMKDRFYDPRHELVKARHRYNTGMQNASDASGGSARFALQNRAQGQLASDTDQILTKARNINAQWNDPARKAQGLMGLAGAYGQVGQMGYGVGRDVQAEQAKKWDLDARTDATARAFTGAGLSQLGQWAQYQQQMENQYNIDSERSHLLKDMFDYGYTPEGWKYNPKTAV